MRVRTLTTRIAIGFLAAAWLLTALPTEPARAEEETGKVSRFFAAYDRDGDGRVTPDELRAGDEIFRLLDKDGDGVITRADLGAPTDLRPRSRRRGRRTGDGEGARTGRGGDRAAKLRERLRAMDENGDGQVTREEFEGPDRYFEALDVNRDGVVCEKDVQARGRRGPGGPGASDAPRAGRGPDPQEIQRRFREMDKNGDGSIDASELKRPEAFQRLDRDGNGQVTPQEFEQGVRRLAGRGRQGARRGLSEQALRRFDRNRDGKVGRDEFPGSDERFDQLDRNDDGVLNEADLHAAGDRPRRRSRDGGRAGAGGPDWAALLERDDVDDDGRISRREYQGGEDRFDQLDRNGDGFLEASEAR